MATSSVYVRPNTPLVPDTIKLSPFDQFSNRVYSPLFLLFKFDEEVPPDVIFSELQTGLASLIDDIPLLAGHVVSGNEHGNLQISIPDDAGITFKVREMLDDKNGQVLDFEELEKANFPSYLLDPSELGPTWFIPEGDTPVLAVQANFIRGGMILAVYVHHSAIDGVGIMILLKRWSIHVAAASASLKVPISETFPAEALDRSPLFSDTGTRRSLHDFPGFAKVTKEAAIQNVLANSESSEPVERSIPTIAYWHISRSSLLELESMANPMDNVAGKVTKSCALSAFIWQHCTRARRSEQRGVQTASIFVRCDARRRLDPPLHPQYIGNAVVHCKAELPITELLSSEPDAFHRIAAAIKDSIEWYSSDSIWELLAAMEATPRFGLVEPIMDVFCETNFKITDMSFIPLQSIEWGSKMGKPCAMRAPAIYVLDGQTIILPRLPDGGIEFTTHLSTEALADLKADRGFTKYAQFRCS